jgi:hypothetical protein
VCLVGMPKQAERLVVSIERVLNYLNLRRASSARIGTGGGHADMGGIWERGEGVPGNGLEIFLRLDSDPSLRSKP